MQSFEADFLIWKDTRRQFFLQKIACALDTVNLPLSQVCQPWPPHLTTNYVIMVRAVSQSLPSSLLPVRCANAQRSLGGIESRHQGCFLRVLDTRESCLRLISLNTSSGSRAWCFSRSQDLCHHLQHAIPDTCTHPSWLCGPCHS